MLDDLRTEIERLRAAALPLEPDAEARRDLGAKALDHALAYLDQVETASTNRPWSEVFAQRLDPEFADEGRDPERVLDYVAECIDRPGVATTSPKFMAYIPGGGLFPAALAGNYGSSFCIVGNVIKKKALVLGKHAFEIKFFAYITAGN